MRGAYGITNVGTALLLILEVLRRHLDELHPGWFDAENGTAQHKGKTGKIPLSLLFETELIPASLAAQVKRQIGRARSEKRIAKPMQIPEMWAKEEEERSGKGKAKMSRIKGKNVQSGADA